MTSTGFWAAGDPERLARVARQMEATGSWRNYLSGQEQKVLSAALEADAPTWAAFINGQLPLSMRIHEPVEENEARTLTSTPVEPSMLAMRVRYMIYDVAVAAHYNQSACIDLDKLDSISSSPTVKVADKGGRIEEDDYDDYDEDGEPDASAHAAAESSACHTEHIKSSCQPAVTMLEVDVEDDEEPDFRNARELLANYARMYHTLETDLGVITRYRKWQESDRQIEIEGEKNTIEKLASSAQFGAANLSLKHLLGIIEAKRDVTNLTDVELRNLISDVRKNRSKWASEERIGQEELYEAAEKVVQDLRATTEHSTAFLNRVSKREAPNYYQIIKKPMDLNTVMKKLKTLQYMSKKEFVDDLMIIWENCFTYNSDPKHFLRAHATVMRKKTLALIPLVPDITIRSRAEVEAEAQAEAQAEAAEQEEAAASGRGKTAKGTKRRRTGNNEVEQNEPGKTDTGDVSLGEEQDPQQSTAPGSQSTDTGAVATNTAATPGEIAESTADSDDRKLQHGESAQSALAADDTTMESSGDEGGGAEGESSHATEAAQTFAQDIESTLWNRAFSQRRSDYLAYRNQLFHDNKIQADADVHLRGAHAMSRFAEIQRTAASGMPNHSILTSRIADEDIILTEYDTSSSMPPEPRSQIVDETLPRLEDLPPSKYIATGKLANWVMSNLEESQSIRRVLAKVAVIREMQMNPQAYTPFDLPKHGPVKDPEEDVASRLPHAEMLYGPAALSGMHRTCAKIAMMVGFESTQPTAADVLAEIAGEYLEKLGRLLVSGLEDTNNPGSLADILLGTMNEMGISSSHSLLRYMSHDIIRYNKKLADLKVAVNGMLADLLRPGVESYHDDHFKENSEQFTLGQFSNELGDDYFGFRELGLDKEIGIDSFTVPFHLLQQRAKAEAESERIIYSKFEIDLPPYPPVTKTTYTNLIGLVQPFFARRFKKYDSLLEDDKIPTKLKYTRPRVPVTGKILAKRKPQRLLYVRDPKPVVVSEPEPVPEPKPEETVVNATDQVDDNSVDFLFKDDERNPTNILGNASLDFGVDFNIDTTDGLETSANGDLDSALDAFESVAGRGI